MKDWIIEGGSLLLRLRNGLFAHPAASDLYAQRDATSYTHEEEHYSPISSVNLRFSSLTVHFHAEFIFDKQIRMELCWIKNGAKYYISRYKNLYNDYILANGVWRYVDPIIESVNKLLSSENIDNSAITFQQYILLNRELSELGIPILDNVYDKVQILKESQTYQPPHSVNANLYPYQQGGARWLEFMTSQRCGSILGDEMGLGKTLQIISVMAILKEKKPSAHFLVICPVSLLENWRRELEKFCPSLTVNVHYGSKRTGDYRELYKYDVNITSYSSAITDAGLLSLTNWELLVIDEAQNIKNPRAKRTRAVKSIKCDVPIAVTGTPFENHMTDIWSLVDFIIPGFLGTIYEFESKFSDCVESAIQLEKLISPIILRRKVKDVAKDLPKRVDIPQSIIMNEEEANLYEGSRISNDPFVELKQLQLAKIQKLRTFCTHPCVYDENYSSEDPTAISTKYKRLCEILEEIFENKEKVVIFTSFRRMIELMCQDIKHRFGVYTNFIDGSVEAKNRMDVVDDFSRHIGPAALILNPKAAGAGLNITCANHAIHYNLEWNPAVEDQASARVYRRGQEKVVFIHRLYYANTIEEIINEKIQSKRLLSENAIIGNTGEVTEQDYIIKALSASPYKN